MHRLDFSILKQSSAKNEQIFRKAACDKLLQIPFILICSNMYRCTFVFSSLTPESPVKESSKPCS